MAPNVLPWLTVVATLLSCSASVLYITSRTAGSPPQASAPSTAPTAVGKSVAASVKPPPDAVRAQAVQDPAAPVVRAITNAVLDRIEQPSSAHQGANEERSNKGDRPKRND